jgi:hypothetical protein
MPCKGQFVLDSNAPVYLPSLSLPLPHCNNPALLVNLPDLPQTPIHVPNFACPYSAMALAANLHAAGPATLAVPFPSSVVAVDCYSHDHHGHSNPEPTALPN